MFKTWSITSKHVFKSFLVIIGMTVAAKRNELFDFYCAMCVNDEVMFPTAKAFAYLQLFFFFFYLFSILYELGWINLGSHRKVLR